MHHSFRLLEEVGFFRFPLSCSILWPFFQIYLQVCWVYLQLLLFWVFSSWYSVLYYHSHSFFFCIAWCTVLGKSSSFSICASTDGVWMFFGRLLWENYARRMRELCIYLPSIKGNGYKPVVTMFDRSQLVHGWISVVSVPCRLRWSNYELKQ